ncbi:MAG: hypothetical protein ACOC6D_02355 [Atribacterota bacterium]
MNDLESKTKIPVIALYADPIGTPEQDKLFYNSLQVNGDSSEQAYYELKDKYGAFRKFE